MSKKENEKNSIMQVQGLRFCYGGDEENPTLRDINFDIPKGNFVSLIGPNGSGKSTLLKLLCGINRPNSGIVNYNGTDINLMNVRNRAKEMAVIHQREKNEFPFSCIDTVIMGLHPHRERFECLSKEQLEEVERIMKLTDTYEFSQKLTTQISGGELQRVNLARAIVQRPRALLMDEAMSDMDVNAKIKLTKLVKNLVDGEGLTVIAVNHDLNMAYRFSDYIIAMNDGKVDSLGTPEKVMNEEFFNRVFRVKAEVVEGRGFFILDNI